jgi:hypothetical protein
MQNRLDDICTDWEQKQKSASRELIWLDRPISHSVPVLAAYGL